MSEPTRNTAVPRLTVTRTTSSSSLPPAKAGWRSNAAPIARLCATRRARHARTADRSPGTPSRPAAGARCTATPSSTNRKTRPSNTRWPWV